MPEPENAETKPAFGILMLQTRFPRFLGDIGNPDTWPFPVSYRVVDGAGAERIIRQDPASLLPDFIAAANELVAEGCAALLTSCGFLSLMQRDLAKAVPVPVATSALLQVPLVQRMLPANARVGVLTISAETLSSAHLAAAGINEDVALGGMPAESHFVTSILGDAPTLHRETCQIEVVEAAQDLVERAPDIAALVVECTNMVPYSAAIQERTGRPVYSIYTLAVLLHSALQPRGFK